MPHYDLDDYANFLTQKSIVVSILIASIMLIIFVTDLQFTTELYIGVLYIIVVMLSLWLPGTLYTLIFATSSTVLAILGYFYSIYAISPGTYWNVENFINLSMTISVIWITTLIAMYVKRMSIALTRSEKIYKAILDASIDPLLIVDKDGTIESVSNTIESCLGWEPKDIIGKRFSNLLGMQYKDQYENLLVKNDILDTSPFIGTINEAVAVHRMHREFPCEISVNYIELPQFSEAFFAVGMRDISMRKAYEDKLGWMSSHDELTKIYNRRYFNEQINKEWLRMLRNHTFLSLIIIDVDFFKNYNDSLGHQAGDLCLQKIAACVEDCCRRAGDLVARYGGEEFTVLMPGTDIVGAQQVAANIKNKVSDLNIAHPNSEAAKKVTVSMGVTALIPSMGCSYERLIRFADQALYEAKHSGRNRFNIYKEE